MITRFFLMTIPGSPRGFGPTRPDSLGVLDLTQASGELRPSGLPVSAVHIVSTWQIRHPSLSARYSSLGFSYERIQGSIHMTSPIHVALSCRGYRDPNQYKSPAGSFAARPAYHSELHLKTHSPRTKSPGMSFPAARHDCRGPDMICMTAAANY